MLWSFRVFRVFRGFSGLCDVFLQPIGARRVKVVSNTSGNTPERTPRRRNGEEPASGAAFHACQKHASR